MRIRLRREAGGGIVSAVRLPTQLILAGGGALGGRVEGALARVGEVEVVGRLDEEEWLCRGARGIEARRERHPAAGWVLALGGAANREIAALLGPAVGPEASPRVLVPPWGLAPPPAGWHLLEGWAALPGVRKLLELARREGLEGGPLSVRLRASGSPEGEPELIDCLLRALPVARALLPDAALRASERVRGLRLELSGEGGAARVELAGGPPALRLELERGRLVARFRCDAEGQALEIQREGFRPERREGGAPDPLALSLRRALGAGPTPGAQKASAIAEEILRRHGPLPPRLAPLRRSASMLLRGLGAPALGLGAPAPVDPIEGGEGEGVPERARIALPAPFEACAFALGSKPALYLILDEQELLRCRELLASCSIGGSHVEVRPTMAHERRGEGSFSLFASREPSALRRLLHLQQSPGAELHAIGALLGYPPCCVEAFASQAERGEDVYNRYAAAKRSEAEVGSGSWASVLNDSEHKLLPHFVCHYRCGASISQAEALLRGLGSLGVEVEALRAALRGPVLYFDPDHRLHFDGERSGEEIRYRSLSGRWAARGGLAALLSRGDRLRVCDRELAIFHGESPIGHMLRTDPEIGILMPFGRAEQER